MIDPDGRAHLGIDGPGERVGAAFHRVDAAARKLRRQGDRRSLAQVRADVARDLLTFGQLPKGHDHGYTLPPAQIHVVVSLATLLGLTDAPSTVEDPSDTGIHITEPPRPRARHRDDDGLGEPDPDSAPAWEGGPSYATVDDAWHWIRHHYAVLLEVPPF